MRKTEKNTENNPKTLPVRDIHFSQHAVAENFDNGMPLALTIQQLIDKQIQAENFPPIRVIKHMGQWWSLDNRRLRVFKDAFITQVPIIICYLTDADIKREYFAKKTNNSLGDGGEIWQSSTYNAQNTNHFDEGVYIFTKKVLSWRLEQVQQPLPQLTHVTEFPPFHFSRTNYFSQFLDPILEDARASINSELETISTANIKPIPFTLKKSKIANKPENPSTLTLEKENNDEFDVKSSDVILLQSSSHSSLKLIAMATYNKENTTSQRIIHVKSILDTLQQNIYSDAFEENAKWVAWHLGSVITHMRMYDACVAMPQTPFEQQLLSGNIAKNTVENTITHSALDNLNPAQQKAVKNFLQIATGIQLIEGPPGTGKTTTLVALLKILLDRGERVLVSAPSNKAIQVIAEKFMQQNPNAPAILVGVEEKLTDNPDLQKIFIHTWGEDLLSDLNEIIYKLWDLLPEKINANNKKSILKTLEDIIDFFSKILADIKLYQLSNFKTDETTFTTLVKNYRDSIEKSGINDIKSNAFQKSGHESLTKISSIVNTLIAKVQVDLSDNEKSDLEQNLLNGAKIIFTTLSVAGRKSLKKMNPVTTLIVDEAAQAVEAEILIALSCKPQKMLLIGDTHQLPATVFSENAKKLKYDRSLMWRLIKDCNQEYSLLTIQHRMHPKIRQWPSGRYYNGRLEDHVHIQNGSHDLPELKHVEFLHPYSFIDSTGKEEKNHRSFVNYPEIQLIGSILNYLDKFHKINVPVRVGIITFYKGQADALNKQFQQKYSGIKIQTVDGFQGGENDFIIVSFVRSNSLGNVGFLNDFRRLNVAITRARHSLIMIGNAATLKAKNSDLQNLIQYTQDSKCYFKSENIQNFLETEEKNLLLKQQKKGQTQKSPYKTQLCNFFIAHNFCRSGNDCNFAHNQNELVRPKESSVNQAAKNLAQMSLTTNTTARIASQTQHATHTTTTQTKPSMTAKPKEPKLCAFFNGKPNSCFKGNHCDFKHSMDHR